MIVHVSSGDAMEQIRWAQSRGLKIYGETCPQYLVLTAEDLAASTWKAPNTSARPPPRDPESQQACWEGLINGTFSTFSSDHCPFRSKATLAS